MRSRQTSGPAGRGRGGHALVGLAVTLLMVTTLVAAPSGAQESVRVDSEIDYEEQSSDLIVESIVLNEANLTFPANGGPFTGSARLDLRHDVPSQNCFFESFHAWDFEGDYDANLARFDGEYLETEDSTIGNCPNNFQFTRTFDPTEGPLRATIDRSTGELRSQVPPLQFTALVDPTSVPEPNVPEGPSTTTLSSQPTTDPSDPATTTTIPEERGGFPWLVVLPILALLGGVGWWLFNRQPASLQEAESEKDPCAELQRLWQEARDNCRKSASHADDLSRQFDRIENELKEKEAAHSALPSEETRVELPDGRSLSQLDLELRRNAAGAAWDEYMANPNPDTAKAAEEAWRDQASPEWLEEQRRTHRQSKEGLESEIETVKRSKEEVGQRLAKARDDQQDLCAKAADLDARLAACRKQAAELAKAPKPPESGPEPPLQPEPTSQSTPPASGPAPQPIGGEGDDTGRCAEGSERKRYDGPHPFELPANQMVGVRIALKAGTRIYPALGSLNQAMFTTLDQRGQANRIPFSDMVDLSSDEVRDAFGGLTSLWGSVGAGAVQELTIYLTWETRSVLTSCLTIQVCRGGEWIDTGKRELDEKFSTESISRNRTIRGNLEPGMGKTEETYLNEIIAFMQEIQFEIRNLRYRQENGEETYEQFKSECLGGLR